MIIAAAAAISLGTYAGGWRIMRTLGRRIIHLDPPRGFAAETVAASVLYTTAYIFEAPISTTHTITSAVMGVGRHQALLSGPMGRRTPIVTAWVLTFPMAGGVAAIVYWLLHLPHRSDLTQGRSVLGAPALRRPGRAIRTVESGRSVTVRRGS